MFELLEIHKFNWDFFSSSAGVPMKPDISLLVWHFYSMLLRISSLENNNNNRWAFILGRYVWFWG